MYIDLLVFILTVAIALLIPGLVLLTLMRKRHSAIIRESTIAQERVQSLSAQIAVYENRLDALLTEKSGLEKQLVENSVRLESTQQRLVEQKQELELIHEKLSKEFELISHQIMQKNAESFAVLSRKNVDEIVSPLREKLGSFETVVRETYEKDLKDRSSLLEVVKNLQEMNQRLGTEAQNLTKALKGDSKTRGNWGEFVLEMVLERSGLRKGEDYTTQESLRDADQTRYQPDVIIHLPDRKHIVIDSKVSLVAYESYVSAEDVDERERFLRQHVQAVRRHIKELSEKGYQGLEQVDAPEFVLMFIPIEASFSLTIQEDRDIFQDAWQKKIVMVSPTTLLATLRTVASIWQHEKQTRNALEIAKEGGALVDKIAAVLDDIRRLKSQVATLDKTLDGTLTKVEGQGGLVSRAMKLQKLGAKSKKGLLPGQNDDAEDLES